MPNAAAKGRKLVQLARHYLEAQGCLVEVAANVVRWVPGKVSQAHRIPGDRASNPKGLVPISIHHDLFGLWDLIVLWPAGMRCFYQITVADGLRARRKKILIANFPLAAWDRIACYYPGRNRHFRLYGPPGFEEWTGEVWRLANDKSSKVPTQL